MEFLHSLWTTVGSFLILLTVVVFVHELGHFLVARWVGVRVEAFSIGFGRELVGFTDRRGTRWRLSMLPFGGYVKFFGDGDVASATESDVSVLTDEERALTFSAQKLYHKAAIVFAGPAANFVFAVLVFTVVFMVLGRPLAPAVIGEVRPDSAAAEAGLLAGDRITGIAGHEVIRFEDVQRLVPLYGTQEMELSFERGGSEQTVKVRPRMEGGDGRHPATPILGVMIHSDSFEIIEQGPVDAFVSAVENTWTITRSTAIAMGQMLSGARGTEDIGGPLRIAEFSGEAARSGFFNYVMFISVLSINLGMINLFPVPVLDGGHLALYAIEGLRGKPLGEKAQEIGVKIGLSLVLALMVFATWNDIVRFFR